MQSRHPGKNCPISLDFSLFLLYFAKIARFYWNLPISPLFEAQNRGNLAIGDTSPAHNFHRQREAQNRGFGEKSPEMATLNSNEGCSVSNMFDLESALFCVKRRQKAPQFISFIKMTPHTIFIAFLCDNFSKATQSCKIILNSNFFPRIFLANLKNYPENP